MSERQKYELTEPLIFSYIDGGGTEAENPSASPGLFGTNHLMSQLQCVLAATIVRGFVTVGI